MRGYRRVAENQIAPALGKRRISKLTAEEIDRFYRALAEAGYSQSTIHQTHIVLRRVLESARRWRWISYNPARDAKPPRVPRGELCGLRWSRVDLDAAKVRFDHSIGEAGGVYEKDTKNHQHRTVSLSPVAVEVLRAHHAAMRDRATICGTELAEGAFVFSNAADGAAFWWPSTLDAAFRRLRRRAGLPETVKLHGLRHTQVTQLLDAGVPLRMVSGRVGHRNSSTTTNIYAHWIAETDERAAEVVNARIWGRPDANPSSEPTSPEAS